MIDKALSAIFGFIILVILNSCSETRARIQVFRGDAQNPTIRMLDSVYFDYGQITTGTRIKHTFRLKNAGSSALVIKNVLADGKVSARWPEKPIAPGEIAKIDITYDSKSTLGTQREAIDVVTNANPDTTRLGIGGYIVLFPMR